MGVGLGVGRTFLECYEVLALSFGFHNVRLSHSSVYSCLVAIFLGEGLFCCRKFALFALLLSWMGERSWVPHLSFFYTDTSDHHCLHENAASSPYHVCTIFVQISLPPKWRWAAVFQYSFLQNNSNLLTEKWCSENCFSYKTVPFQRKFWICQSAAFWLFLNWKKKSEFPLWNYLSFNFAI